MIVLGLTGSMAMGKSTTAGLFSAEGAAVYDADAAVHVLYRPGGAGGVHLRQLFPEAVAADGEVRRDRLRAILAADPGRLPSLEAEVFPLLTEQRRRFLAAAAAAGRPLAILDVPLLYETGGDKDVDAVVVATAAPDVQRARMLGRPGMDDATFALLESRQMSDLEKRRRADFVVHTDDGLEAAACQVREIVRTVLAARWKSPRSSKPETLLTVDELQGNDSGGSR
jgi:dephospho-CoA kinase